MSVDNLTMLHTAAFTPFHTLPERPKLGMMLPDPTQRYAGSSPQAQGGAVSPASSTASQGFYDHRPQIQHSQSFSLPPIRELLKDTATPAVSVPVRAASASAASTTSMPSPMAQPIPSSRPIPSLHQMPSPQYQPPPYHMTSVTPPPGAQMSQGAMGRSSSLPNYLAHYGGRVPSPSLPYPQQAPPPSQYPMHMGNMMPTPESRSETASPVHGEMLSMPLYNEVSKDAKLASRKKRQNLPRQTTLILLSWLSEHLDRPYPNSREKYDLLVKTRLTIQQLDNWFINARRRKINELRKLKESDQSIALMF